RRGGHRQRAGAGPGRRARGHADARPPERTLKPEMAAAQRRAFMAALDGGVAVLRSGSEVIRNRDTHYRFRPDSDFWYLTGFGEPDSVAVLRPGADEERYVLFVRPRDPG